MGAAMSETRATASVAAAVGFPASDPMHVGCVLRLHLSILADASTFQICYPQGTVDKGCGDLDEACNNGRGCCDSLSCIGPDSRRVSLWRSLALPFLSSADALMA